MFRYWNIVSFELSSVAADGNGNRGCVVGCSITLSPLERKWGQSTLWAYPHIYNIHNNDVFLYFSVCSWPNMSSSGWAKAFVLPRSVGGVFLSSLLGVSSPALGTSCYLTQWKDLIPVARPLLLPRSLHVNDAASFLTCDSAVLRARDLSCLMARSEKKEE